MSGQGLKSDMPEAQVRLRKDLVREIKRGHAWLYSHAVEPFHAPAGGVVQIWDRKGQKRIASGIADNEHPIVVRVCRTEAPFELGAQWLEGQLSRAWRLRWSHFDESTTGWRLVNGEGDGLPGLIVDVYGSVAVMKVDGGAPQAFYVPSQIANWLAENTPIESVVLRSRRRGRAGESLVSAGKPIELRQVHFLENGLRFTADTLEGQKTGFFLDQRDNRDIVRRLSRDKRVLNLFSFNGGFSVAAGVGGAAKVTSVDIAKPAIEAAGQHWLLNQLPSDRHQGIAKDCFEFLANANQTKQKWEMVICDPPSFAPNEKSVPQATAAYSKLAQSASRVTSPGGILALASCSSHIDADAFRQINLEALGRSRRKATLLAERGLPIDHPTPIAMPELRYLKFLLFQLD